jgi:adenosylmethionine-8-amino-7-oxononanoate aminotransferase
MGMTSNSAPANNLDAFFMPFTANRQFKKNPRMLARAKGVHYWTPEGRKIIDGTAGLWCVNAGHGREEIKTAIAQAARRDGLRAVLPDGPSQGIRAGGTSCRAAAG